MTNSLKILFFGDFVAQEPKNITLSQNLQDLINSSDFSVCNFEAVISGEYQAVLKSGPALQQSSYSPEFLSSIGIDMVSLANNHCFDYGEAGLRSTVSSFQKIIPIGVGNFSEVYNVNVVTIRNIKVGFLALTQLETGALTNDCTEEDIGCAWINHPCVNSLILNIKNEVDYLFILSHAGVEDIEIPLPEWRTRYKELIDCGADAIIASHPHVPQGWETYSGKPIFYSLGNFCFESNCRDKYWNIGLGVQICISLDGIHDSLSFKVSVVEFKDSNLGLIDNSEINNHLADICNILTNEEKYMTAVNDAALLLWTNIYSFYFHYFTSSLTFRFGFVKFIKMFYNRLFRKSNSILLLNIISCESHRYIITRALKLKSKI